MSAREFSEMSLEDDWVRIDDSTDYLSKCQSLPRICEYLEPIAAIRCLLVSRKFNEIISQNENRIRRRPADICVSCLKSNDPDVQDRSSIWIYCCFYPLWLKARMFAELRSNSIITWNTSEKAHSFLSALQKQLGGEASSTIRYVGGHIRLTTENVGSAQILKNAIICILKRASCKSLELKDDSSISSSNYYGSFTDEQLKGIGAGLSASRPCQLQDSSITLHFSRPVHAEIVRVAGMTHAFLHCARGFLNGNGILDLCTDTRTCLSIEARSYMPRVSLNWLKLLIQEWLKGTRNLRSINYNPYPAINCKTFPSGVDDTIAEMMDICEYFHVESKNEELICLRLLRKSDNKILHAVLTPGIYNIHCEY